MTTRPSGQRASDVGEEESMGLVPNTDPAVPPPARSRCQRGLPDSAQRRSVLPLAACLGALLAASLALPTPASAGYVSSVLVDGLDNPRGLAFDPGGALYVTEAGVPVATGPSTAIRGGTFVLGQTGSVIRLQGGGGAPQTVLAGLASLSSATAGTTAGAQGIAFDPASGRGYVAVGLGAAPGVRATDLAPGGAGLGTVIGFDPGGGAAPTVLADVAGFQAAHVPGVADSNPFHLAAAPGGGLLVTDAGTNALLGVGYDGTVSTLAAFPARALGGARPTEAVPTGVAVGPDGAAYVAEFTGAPYVPGSAQIYRVAPGGGAASVYLTGFTNISDLAFGADGSLYVLELDADGLSAPGTDGALIRVAPDGTRTTLFSAGLVAPTGPAIGPDGAFYVSNDGNSAGGGQVLRITAAVAEDVPEPASLTLLGSGLLGLALACRRRTRRLRSRARRRQEPRRIGRRHGLRETREADRCGVVRRARRRGRSGGTDSAGMESGAGRSIAAASVRLTRPKILEGDMKRWFLAAADQPPSSDPGKMLVQDGGAAGVTRSGLGG